jgi:uncharacterized protein (TIGR04141 family)
MSSIAPTIYLVKPIFTGGEDIFKDIYQHTLDRVTNGDSTFYYRDPTSNPAKWAGFVNSHFAGIPGNIFQNSSSYGLIITKVNHRYFAIPLGMGIHLLNTSMLEFNFGLKAVINSVPKDELYQMDLTTPESNSQKTKKQASKSSTVEDFGINKQKDILRGVVGRLPKGHALGERMEGKDSVRISKKVSTLADLRNLCELAFNASTQVSYKNNYPWIDNMAVVSDPVDIAILDGKLLSDIKANNLDEMFICPPEFIDNISDYDGYIFTGNRKRKSGKVALAFPAMSDFMTGYDIAQFDIETLKKSRLVLSHPDNIPSPSWSMYKCICWETNGIGTDKFILSEGSWYKVDSSFYTKVEDFYKSRKIPAFLDAPEAVDKEKDYNKRISSSLANAQLFDLGCVEAKNKWFGPDKNEVCDIFDVAGKRLIHVKAGKSSSDLSHLFRQAVFSSSTLKQSLINRTLVQQHLSDGGCNSDLMANYTPQSFKVDFIVMLKHNQNEDIPFFSKVSMKDAFEQSLEMMGHVCSLSFVKAPAPIVNENAEEVDEAA